jgi:hypothetical protein
MIHDRGQFDLKKTFGPAQGQIFQSQNKWVFFPKDLQNWVENVFQKWIGGL